MPVLPAGEAHVWLSDTGAGAPRCPQWLDEDEQRRWARLLRPAERDLFLVAHCHLRTTLSRYAQLLPAAWRFVRRPGGRPELAEGTLRFNLSHTPGLVACVVSHGPCGVDVECDGRVQNWPAVARWLLHEDEFALAGDPARMLARWTCKEAYVKATGTGIRAPLRELSLERPDQLECTHMRPTATHHLAVALTPAQTLTVRWA
jgi:4'-phosphopantetheinyl transferase